LTPTVRIWRLRKRQHSIDAVLRKNAGGGLTLDFVLNGRRMPGRRWPTRARAMKAASEKREELERAGWATHW
jgi:hypothetical protein